MIKISYQKLQEDVTALAQDINETGKDYSNIFAIPRGGVPIACLLSEILKIPIIDEVTPSTLVVDDLIDSGKTLDPYVQNFDTAVVYRKPHSPGTTYAIEEIDDWIEFPYESTEKDEIDTVTRLLELLGENPNREGLQETPKRVIKFYKEFLDVPKFNFTVFDSEQYDEMIVQKDIPFFSICEHHLAPFFGKATVSYIPNGKIVGLSKLARTVDHFSRRFQNQERITTQIADKLQEELDPLGVAVVLEARHFCMEMRGIKTHDVATTTSKLLGVFKDKPEVRSEFMSIMKG